MAKFDFYLKFEIWNLAGAHMFKVVYKSPRIGLVLFSMIRHASSNNQTIVT